MSRDTGVDRRTVVKALGAGAGLAAGLGATGSSTDVATASHGGGCDCFFEYRCDTTRFCSDSPPASSPYQQQHRECCECDGNKVCEDTWSDIDTACCSG